MKLEHDIKEIPKKIKLALLNKGWTQKHLADLIGENRTQLNRAINGEMTPKAKEIRQKIYEILDIK